MDEQNKSDIVDTIFAYTRKLDVLQKSIDSLRSMGVVTLDLVKDKKKLEQEFKHFLQQIVSTSGDRVTRTTDAGAL